jgi:tRNA-dihydrouridine synthase
MKGFTDCVFRRIFALHFNGFDLAIAPFLASKRDCPVRRRHVRDLWPENNPNLTVVPQILSKVAADFTALANYLYDMGYPTVNWNLGCPSPMVASKKRGAGLLPHTDRIDMFLDDALAGMKGRLSIKIRLGWQSSDDLSRLMPVLDRYPLEEIIIHPRTGVQAYTGTTDLDAFEAIRDLSEHRVVYNGDIRTRADYTSLATRFPDINHWMIGRGFLSDPFLPQTIKTGCEAAADRLEMMRNFHDDLFEAYRRVLRGPSHLLKKMKGLWRYFALAFEPFDKTMKEIKKATRPEQYLQRVDRFFNSEAKSVSKCIPENFSD